MTINFSKSPFTRGIEKANRAFGKPDNHDLITLFGYMSAGKTEFTYYVARKNVEQGVKVCYVSLELDKEAMITRIARKSAGVSKLAFQTGDYGEGQQFVMESVYDKLEQQEGLYIIKPDNSSMTAIMRACREHYDLGCRMFVIDNLDKITGDENDNTRYQKISSSFQDFKNEVSACVILIHHAKKPMNKQTTYMPAGMSGIRGSQKILDNSTQVIEIRRDLDPDVIDPKEKSKVYLYQYKDTFEGANGYCEIYFDKGSYHEEYQA